MINTVLYYVLYVVVLFSLFVNDYFLFDKIALFYVGWVVVISLRFVLGIKYKNTEAQIQIFLLLLLTPLIINELINASGIYWNSYLFIPLSVNILFVFPYLLSKPKALEKVSLSIIVIFTGAALIAINGSERFVFVFGPNVLYRVFSFLFISFIVSTLYRDVSTLKKVFVLSCYFIINGATLSRGATIVTFITLLSIYLLQSDSLHKKIMNISGVLIMMAGAYFLLIKSYGLNRLFFFNVDGSARYEFLLTAKNIITDLPLLGLMSNNQFFPFPKYPHNYIVEGTIYSGWYFTSILALCLFSIIWTFMKKNKNLKLLPLFFLGVLIGGQFSGSLFDNFIVVSLGVTLFSLSILKKKFVYEK